MPRFFVTPSRGEEREKMLAGFRAGLRLLVDPATGAPYTEAKIARATREGGRWYAEFDAVDLAVLALHAKAGGLADQMIPSRSTTGTLRGLHAPLRGIVPLPATGGTNVCEAVATVGSLFVGSTTLPDSAAAFATDPSGASGRGAEGGGEEGLIRHAPTVSRAPLAARPLPFQAEPKRHDDDDEERFTV